MPILSIIQDSPFGGMAVLVCLCTIVLSIRNFPRSGNSRERFLVGFVGFIAIYEGLRNLKEVGFFAERLGRQWTDFAAFGVSTVLLIALIVIRLTNSEHRATKRRLRLAEAAPGGNGAQLPSHPLNEPQ